MTYSHEIKNALGHIGNWKAVLIDAVVNNRTTLDAKTVSDDSKCPFGIWLESLHFDVKKTNEYANIVQLHLDFHNASAAIVEVLNSGNQQAAMMMIDPKSVFLEKLGKLVLALTTWQAVK